MVEYDQNIDKIIAWLQAQPLTPEVQRNCDYRFEAIYEFFSRKTPDMLPRLRVIWIDDDTISVIDMNQLEI